MTNPVWLTPALVFPTAPVTDVGRPRSGRPDPTREGHTMRSGRRPDPATHASASRSPTSPLEALDQLVTRMRAPALHDEHIELHAELIAAEVAHQLGDGAQRPTGTLLPAAQGRTQALPARRPFPSGPDCPATPGRGPGSSNQAAGPGWNGPGIR